jgi:hypothetical protein
MSVPMDGRLCSPIVQLIVPDRFVPRFGTKFPEWGTYLSSLFPVSKILSGSKREVQQVKCVRKARARVGGDRPVPT